MYYFNSEISSTLPRQPSTEPVVNVNFFPFGFRFPNNFGLFLDPASKPFEVSVVWVVRDIKDDGEYVTGRKFLTMSTSWEDDDFSLAQLHSYRVTNISMELMKWPLHTLVGKGTCLYLGDDSDFQGGDADLGFSRRNEDDDEGPISQTECLPTVDFKNPTPNQHWQFDLLDHCINYQLITRKEQAAPVLKRRRVCPST